jgi:nicotinate (nicotinamide) nucleotide adenylyltransferase
MRRVAVYGGAFDPPHLAHVFAVGYLLGRADVDVVRVVPTGDHAFGKRMAPFADRMAMVRAAMGPFDSERVVLDPIEAERGGTNRTYDTLEALEQAHPDEAYAWVVGADNLAEAHRWYRFDDLAARWPAIVLGRPGAEAALARYAGEPWCRPGPMLPDISSTAIREALAGRGSPEVLAWLPDGCREIARRLYLRPAPRPGPVYVLGAGRAGQAMAAGLRAAGVTVAGVWNRSPRPGATVTGALPADLGDAPVWLLCVSDAAIADLATDLAAHPAAGPGRVALHTAGRLGAEVLAPLAARGVSTGSLHPLQSLRDAEGAVQALRGAAFAVEGDAEALTIARALAEAVGGRPVTIPAGGKPAYHAAAVLSANFVATLTGGGVALLEALGLSDAEARRLLTPLLRGTVANLERVPAAEALTGPFARGDLDAVAAHVAALRAKVPEFLGISRELGRTTARWLGWDAARLSALEAALA